MKWLALLMVAGTLFAQHGSKKKSASPTTPPAPQVDYDARYACQLDRGYHKCSCPNMVHRVQEAQFKDCAKFPDGSKEYQACAKAVPTFCNIVQNPDKVEPKNTCQRSCTHARCACDDGPPCFGPDLTQPQYGDGGDN